MNKQFLRFGVFLLMCLTLPLNTTAQKMYWTDEATGKIQRANIDGSNIEDLVTSPDWIKPEAIALDVARRQDVLDRQRHRQNPTR